MSTPFTIEHVTEENTRGCNGCYPDNEPDPGRRLTKVVLGYGSLALCDDCLERMHITTAPGQRIVSLMEALEASIAAAKKAAQRETEASEPDTANRPNCVACGDWDDTVSERPVTSTTHAMLCFSCAASAEVVATLAAEDGLDEVDE